MLLTSMKERSLAKLRLTSSIMRALYVQNLLQNYIEGQMKLNGSSIDHEQLQNQVKGLVDKSYFSLLEDSNTAKRLEAVKPLLLPNK